MKWVVGKHGSFSEIWTADTKRLMLKLYCVDNRKLKPNPYPYKFNWYGLIEIEKEIKGLKHSFRLSLPEPPFKTREETQAKLIRFAKKINAFLIGEEKRK